MLSIAPTHQLHFTPASLSQSVFSTSIRSLEKAVNPGAGLKLLQPVIIVMGGANPRRLARASICKLA
jgi:hypothetical protein